MAKILVVDDDPDFVEIARMVLTSNGYEVETASDGEMALRLMRQSPPDVALLDVMMTDVLDGYHVAQVISEDPELNQVPIIMISSITNSPMAGMFPTDAYLPIDTWISKPVQPEDLLAKVARFVQANDAQSGQ